MTTPRSVALALVAGILGVFAGRALPRDASNAGAIVPATSVSPVTAPTSQDCKAKGVELSSTRLQLALCMAYHTPDPEGEDSRAPGIAALAGGNARLNPRRTSIVHRENEDRKLLDSYPEAVIVQHPDGKVGIYKPDEWPVDGDGQIVARKFSDGRIAWYAGPDAGSRSDPAAFPPPDPSNIMAPPLVYQPDGTITLDGVEAAPAVQSMFGGKVRDAGP